MSVFRYKACLWARYKVLPRATLKLATGSTWPLGQSLDSPVLEYYLTTTLLVQSCVIYHLIGFLKVSFVFN